MPSDACGYDLICTLEIGDADPGGFDGLEMTGTTEAGNGACMVGT